jgi:hypothetical protein
MHAAPPLLRPPAIEEGPHPITTPATNSKQPAGHAHAQAARVTVRASSAAAAPAAAAAAAAGPAAADAAPRSQPDQAEVLAPPASMAAIKTQPDTQQQGSAAGALADAARRPGSDQAQAAQQMGLPATPTMAECKHLMASNLARSYTGGLADPACERACVRGCVCCRVLGRVAPSWFQRRAGAVCAGAKLVPSKPHCKRCLQHLCRSHPDMSAPSTTSQHKKHPRTHNAQTRTGLQRCACWSASPPRSSGARCSSCAAHTAPARRWRPCSARAA